MSDSPLLLRDKQLAELLGVGRATIHAWRAAGNLPPPLRIGGAVRWRRDEIEAWLAAGAPDVKTWQAVKEQTSRQRLRLASGV